MQDFTPDQINGLTSEYRSMARALSEYQTIHWYELSHEQQLDLNAYQNSLLNRAQDLSAHATRPAFTNAVTISTGTEQLLHDARISLKRIHSVVIALSVGALAVALASYIARSDLRGIQTAQRELANLLAQDA